MAEHKFGAHAPSLRACLYIIAVLAIYINIIWLIFVEIRFIDISQYDAFLAIFCSYMFIVGATEQEPMVWPEARRCGFGQLCITRSWSYPCSVAGKK